MRIVRLYRRSPILEVGGYPFYFSMCLRELGIDLTTVDFAPQQANGLIRAHSLLSRSAMSNASLCRLRTIPRDGRDCARRSGT